MRAINMNMFLRPVVARPRRPPLRRLRRRRCGRRGRPTLAHTAPCLPPKITAPAMVLQAWRAKEAEPSSTAAPWAPQHPPAPLARRALPLCVDPVALGWARQACTLTSAAAAPQGLANCLLRLPPACGIAPKSRRRQWQSRSAPCLLWSPGMTRQRSRTAPSQHADQRQHSSVPCQLWSPGMARQKSRTEQHRSPHAPQHPPAPLARRALPLCMDPLALGWACQAGMLTSAAAILARHSISCRHLLEELTRHACISLAPGQARAKGLCVRKALCGLARFSLAKISGRHRPSRSGELSARQARTQARKLHTENRSIFLCLAEGTKNIPC